jgi:ATP-dependent DNA helicase RecG
VREIVADMCAPERMHRLLQGDVGSGKTVVAVFAALLARRERLPGGGDGAHRAAGRAARAHLRRPAGAARHRARAHHRQPQCQGAQARGHAARERRAVIAIGTHALQVEGTKFAKLGLAIIDEQHRFGVEHRRSLAERGEKGEKPDILLMSATPIPRSLALTMYGDLDVSILDERPPGRQPVTTALRPENGRERVMAFVNRQLAEGRQAYIVYPLIEESEKVALKAATKAFEELSAGPFKGRRLALLHGKMKADEKDAVMRAFAEGQLDLLVATTVIEVGIDVPNATVMVVEHPERFGLSQLHQLRGRVGRGAEESYCILLGDVGEESAERLRPFLETEDGFAIARADLEQRGMGDLFGERQSGVPMFKVADPLRDEELSEVARRGAVGLLERDPELKRPEHLGMQEVLRRQYGRALELFRVG